MSTARSFVTQELSTAYVSEIFNNLESGDGKGFFDHVADDVDWIVEGTHPLAGHYHSKAEFLAHTFEKLEKVLPHGTELHTEHVLVSGDWAVVELHSLATAKNGMRFDNRYLAALGVTLQWVQGDASRAEKSFHTINTEQTPIGDLEVRLIRDRKCANAIATRALVGAGTGRYSPPSFSDATNGQIKKLAKDVYDDLFVPPLETPIKTLDLPVAGRGYSAETMKLILDFVEFVNPVPGQDPKIPKKRGAKTDILAPTMQLDGDGSQTTQFLDNVRRASSRIAGLKPQSLGLHPAVYFYSATGNYQPTAFLAAIRLIQELERANELNEFTQYRHHFEELLVRHKYLINQIVRKFGAGQRSLNGVSRLYRYVYEGVKAGKEESEVIPKIVEEETMAFLKPIVDFDKGVNKDFTTERKSAVFLAEALKTSVRCGICKARLHRNSINFDHVNDKKHGGGGGEDNAALTHPYCNSTYKEWVRMQAS